MTEVTSAALAGTVVDEVPTESPIHNKRRPPAEEMTMRSWYLPSTSVEQLATLVDDLHLSGGLPKHGIMAAAVTVAARYQAEVEAEAWAAAGH